jgi:phosphate transport system substrate-binding protein
MSQKNETLVLTLALIITLGILGGGYWWFTNKNTPISLNNTTQPDNSNNSEVSNPADNSGNNSVSETSSFPPPSSVPRGTTIRVDGSTSMVQINQGLKNAFELQFPGTVVTTQAAGTNGGIQNLLGGNADIAAISRPLTPQETQQGLVSIAVSQDAIAVMVGINNPFRRGLTQTQILDIFTGKITNWAELGGENTPIRVINRPPISGTHQAFQELVLKGQTFGNGANFTMMAQDATTPILQALNKDGISYATYAQVANQQTVRTIAVDGLTPEASNYPYQRKLSYVYKQPANEAVKAFLGFTTSPKGQDIISVITD